MTNNINKFWWLSKNYYIPTFYFIDNKSLKLYDWIFVINFRLKIKLIIIVTCLSKIEDLTIAIIYELPSEIWRRVFIPFLSSSIWKCFTWIIWHIISCLWWSLFWLWSSSHIILIPFWVSFFTKSLSVYFFSLTSTLSVISLKLRVFVFFSDSIKNID